jgi:drug/metabolite transporter (DMT)-like permease
MALTPVMVAAIGGSLGVERLGVGGWLGIVTSVVGVYLVIRSSNGSEGSLWGDLLVLAATFCWSVYTVGGKPLLGRHGALKVTAYSMCIGSAFFIPFGIPAVVRLPFSQIPWAAWAGLIFSFVFALSIAYLGWYYAVSRVGPSRTAVYSNLTPVAALLTSWLALGERIAPLQLVGAAVILVGIYVVRRCQA